jgi:hypothetical protein
MLCAEIFFFELGEVGAAATAAATFGPGGLGRQQWRRSLCSMQSRGQTPVWWRSWCVSASLFFQRTLRPPCRRLKIDDSPTSFLLWQPICSCRPARSHDNFPPPPSHMESPGDGAATKLCPSPFVGDRPPESRHLSNRRVGDQDAELQGRGGGGPPSLQCSYIPVNWCCMRTSALLFRLYGLWFSSLQNLDGCKRENYIYM